MRKALILVACAVMMATVSFAGGQGNTGCGLGSVLFNDADQDSIILQSLAVTTNGTSWNQTFGITTGTSNCEKPSKIALNDRANEFIRDNMDNLAKDISRGSGETVEGLATLLNVEKAERAGFFAKLQANFDSIYPSHDVDYAHVADSIAAIANS